MKLKGIANLALPLFRLHHESRLPEMMIGV